MTKFKQFEATRQRPWFNVYRDGFGDLYVVGPYAVREDADRGASKERVGCHRITLRAEFEDE